MESDEVKAKKSLVPNDAYYNKTNLRLSKNKICIPL